MERGFDAVTIDEIAEAADVGRMTVFNHFPRKEDMFFDLDDAGREDLRAALRGRDKAVSPVETLRLLAHRLIVERRPYLDFSAGSQRFVETVLASETLKARARAIQQELTRLAAEVLAESVGRDAGDADARLAAGLLLATWAVAFVQAHKNFQRSWDAEAANVVFLTIIDKGMLGLSAAMAGTPYG